MGLDVRVYNEIKLSDNEDNFCFMAYVLDENWKHKIKNLEENKSYTGECIFRGVSYPYSAHNRFRESLIKLIDRKDLLNTDGRIIWENLPENIDFEPFINFADNEGCLDWEISKNIYLDFQKHENKAKEILSEYDFQKYQIWLNTFKIASENTGVVVFS